MSTEPEPGWYEIRLRGRLDQRWASWFAGMTIEAAPDGITVLRGHIVDQAALHGVLARLRDLGIPLISVQPVGEDAGGNAESPGRPPEGGAYRCERRTTR